jgi:hypothetical protein
MDYTSLSVQPGQVNNHTFTSGITWSAVLGGAIVIASMSFILLSLGAGLGFSTITPWSGPGDSTKVIGVATIAWLVAMQAMTGSLGGYLAGRFRNRWIGVHGDEIYFRDTAHGFLAWGLALLGTVTFLAAAATVLAGAATSAPASDKHAGAASPNAYYVDVLLRSSTAPDTASVVVRDQLDRIITRSLVMGTLADEDRIAGGKVVARLTGLDQATSESRMTSVYADARKTATDIKDAAGHSLLWIFVGLLVGAFSASAAATIGGRQRDAVQPG